jgi:hypothetical protein
MIIRSQDKKIVTKFDSVSIVANYKRPYKGERKIVGYQLVVFIGFNTDVVVAEYSTEEKAIKVLDMIEKQYLDYCCNYHSQSGVFQMPQDSEV